jgi:hypothetical protein
MAKKFDVATVLERETPFTIDNWYNRVEQELDLATVPLSRADRCAHLPEMFKDGIRSLWAPMPSPRRLPTIMGACGVIRATPPQ